MKKTVLFLSVFLIVFTQFAFAAEITGSAKISTIGQYLWRGSVLYDGIAVQPELSVALNNFEITYWASYDGMVGDVYRLEESDLWVSFEDALPFAEIVLLNAGFVTYVYHYMNIGESASVEVFAGASLDTLLEPYITFYYDTMLGNGSYLEAGISHSMEIGPVEANAALSTGINFSQYQDDYVDFKPSFTALLLNIGVTYDIAGSGIKIAPAFVGQLALSGLYESAATWSVAVSYDYTIAGAEDKKEEAKEE